MNAYRLSASIFILTFAAFLLAGPARAQVSAGDFEVGFDLGGTRFDDEISDEEDLRAAVRGGYFLTDWFEIEAQLARAEATLDATLDTAMANAVFNLRPAEPVVPYLLLGVGQARFEDVVLFGGDPDSETGLAWQAGIGSRFFFGRDSRIAARLEVSSLWEETLEDTHQHTSLTAGLLWRFGR